MKPYYTDDSVTLWHGDSLDVMRQMDSGAVDCIVTSPPYFGLRDYGVQGQYGLEESPGEYVETMRALFSEAQRVLADHGTFWLNLGDSYSGKANAGKEFTKNRGRNLQSVGYPPQRNTLAHAPYKSLLGIPWRVALALVDDGWILRNDLIWHKPNAMPESVTDRLASRHEHLFLFAKSPRYSFDLDPIREARSEATAARYRYAFQKGGNGASSTSHLKDGGMMDKASELGKNPGDVWAIPTAPFAEAHFAVMAPELASRAVLAGCIPGGTVLDPFSGSGTTGLAAAKHGRKYVGIDLNADYLDLSLRTRLAQTSLLDGEPA